MELVWFFSSRTKWFADSLRAGSGWNWFGSSAAEPNGLLTACKQDQDRTALVLQQQNQMVR